MWSIRRNPENKRRGGGGGGSAEGGRRENRSRFLGWKACGLFVLVLAVTLETVAARAERKPGFQLGENPKPRNCPPLKEIAPCSCSVRTKGLDIICDHTDELHIRNTVDVLKRDSYTIYWMKFRNCFLPRLTDFIFLGLTVKHLNIIRSNLSAVDHSSLSALGYSLETLDLATNSLTAVPTRALQQQTILTFLNLNYNSITSLEASAFAGMTVLQRLSLYENQIKRIHRDTFKGISKLTRLNLGKNKLERIPSDSFHPLSNLEVLDIHENHITHIPDAAFEGLTRLDILKLEHNRITTIQDRVFHDLKLLNSLNIEHNHIVNISDQAFAGLEANLEWLELGNNRLDHIPSHALRPLHKLRQLDLDSNFIQYLQEDAFAGYGDTLKYIILDKNHIKEIPPMAFTDLHSLEWLKIAHNQIRDIPEDTVQPILDTIKLFDLSNNPLECSCNILWLRRWLKNPHNRDNTDSVNEHVCIAKDRKTHVIKSLPDDSFNCPHPPRPRAGTEASTSGSSAIGMDSATVTGTTMTVISLQIVAMRTLFLC